MGGLLRDPDERPPLPTPFYSDDRVTVHHGDCLDVLRTLPDCSVDSVVTDPPYGIEFMGKAWDSFSSDAVSRSWDTRGRVMGEAPERDPSTPGGRSAAKTHIRDNPRCRKCGRAVNGRDTAKGFRVCHCPEPDIYAPSTSARKFQAWCEEWAAECLRVLKPGGHMLAFGGTRTWHRLACAVEDAGFEMRDTIASGSAMLVWCYGSGFPKSRNVSADPLACQCVPDVRDAATTEAAESAAQVLLSDLRGRSETSGADLADLHGLPADLRAEDPLPSDSEQDLLPGMRPCPAIADHDGEALASVSTDGRGCLCSLWEGVPAEAVPTPGGAGILLPVVPGEGACVGADRAQVRCDRHDQAAPLRCGEPGVEGRGYLQAAEGQLYRPEVRALPDGPSGDGPLGRVRAGASAGDGAVDRSPAAAVGSGQPHQPRAEGQSTGESGAVPVERGPQAWRGWPLCGRCGKPALPPGLGTALKPAFEPIVVARKPLTGTVAANVLTHGTGALNIAATRVNPGAPVRDGGGLRGGSTTRHEGWQRASHVDGAASAPHDRGRWPSNVVLTHSPTDSEDGCEPSCPVAELDAQSGATKGTARVGPPGGRTFGGGEMRAEVGQWFGDEGGASRFFPVFRYQAKAPTRERPKVDGVAHPTCKPRDLMRFLVRLVTPPGGVVLDPFAGSGTTAEAAILEGFRCITIEREAEYLPLILERVRRQEPTEAPRTAAEQMSLLDDPAA